MIEWIQIYRLRYALLHDTGYQIIGKFVVLALLIGIIRFDALDVHLTTE